MKMTASRPLALAPRARWRLASSILGLMLFFPPAQALAGMDLALLEAPEIPVGGLRQVVVAAGDDSGPSGQWQDALAQRIRGSATYGSRGDAQASEGVAYGGVGVTALGSPLKDPRKVAGIAAQSGAQAVVVGSVSGSRSPVTRYTQKHERTVETPKGKEKQTFDIPCGKVTIQVIEAFTIYDAHGVILKEHHRDVSNDYADCDEDVGEGSDSITLPSTEEVVERAARTLAGVTADLILPRYVSHRVDLPNHASTKDIVELIEDGAWSEAASDIDEGFQASPFNPAFSYLAAVVLVAEGDRARAREMLDLSERLARDEDHAALRALIQVRDEAQPALAALYALPPGGAPDPFTALTAYRAQVLATPFADAGDPALRVVGGLGSGDVDGYAEPDTKGTVTAQVPQGVYVLVRGEHKRLTQVLLPDGVTQVWLSSRRLKALDS